MRPTITYSKHLAGLLLLLICWNQSWSQSLQITIWRDSLETEVGATFSNRMVIHNPGKQEQTVRIKAVFPDGIQVLSDIPEQLVLVPQDRIMVPIKGLINWKGKSPAERFTVEIQNLEGQLLQSASFVLIATQKNQGALSLSTNDEPILLFSNSEPARLALPVVHNRNSRETYTVKLATIPAGIEQPNSPISIELDARQDTVLAFAVRPATHWLINTTYQLLLTIYDGQQSVVGNAVYKILVVAASKRYIAADAPVNGGYGAGVAVTKMSNNQWAREGRVWGSDSLGRTQMNFQLHYLDYIGTGFRQLQNSFISFRSERAMARLGSSYDYHELSLVGRGVKVGLLNPDHQWTFWAINSNPNWLPTNNLYLWSGNALSLRYDQRLATLPGASWSLSSSVYSQPMVQRAGFLNFASFRYEDSRRQSFEVLAGQSVEQAQHGPNRQRTFGQAGLISYTYTQSKFTGSLRAYLSSPVYAGMQKGATLISGQLQWQPGESTILAARYNQVFYNQRVFVSPTETERRGFGSTIAELSLTHRVQPFTLSLRPYWYAQTDFSILSGKQSSSYRLAPTVAFQRRANQRFDICYDAGYFYNPADSPTQGRYASQRIVSSMVLGPFSFWGYWQRGPYYLLDLRNPHPAGIKTASLTQLVDFALFNRKLIGSTGVNYIYDVNLGQSRLVGIGTVQYDVSPTLAVRLSGYGLPSQNHPEMAFSQYRLQVTKRFERIRLKNRGQLQLSFFEDANGNGLREGNERWVDSLLVTINGNTLLTDARGRITYRNLPPDTYTLSAISTSRLGDPLQYNEKIVVSKSVTKQIPLARTFRIRGQLRCQTSAYERQSCQFGRFGITILRQGELVSSTTPLSDGSFSVHLKPGSYTVLVKDYGRQAQAVVQRATFTLTETGQYPPLEWTIDGSTRLVEVTEFK